VRVIASLYEGEWHGRQETFVDDVPRLTMAVASIRRLPKLVNDVNAS
jgi:hypothetical protein